MANVQRIIVVVVGVLAISLALIVWYNGRFQPSTGAELPLGWSSSRFPSEDRTGTLEAVCAGLDNAQAPAPYHKGWPFAYERGTTASCAAPDVNKLAKIADALSFLAAVILSTWVGYFFIMRFRRP